MTGLTTLAILGGSLERIAVEIRHLQRTEVGEAFEPFGSGQQGSSAMPHKRNPVLAERVTGMARLLRADAIVGDLDLRRRFEETIDPLRYPPGGISEDDEFEVRAFVLQLAHRSTVINDLHVAIERALREKEIAMS